MAEEACEIGELGDRDSNPDKQIQSPFQPNLRLTEIYLNTHTDASFWPSSYQKSG